LVPYLDPAVRDTWEISPDLVSLGVAGLDAALAELADDLGIPAGCLEAALHALLVYGSGQFFVPHTDTEKMTRPVVVPNWVFTAGFM
jgi:hypothetical protein